MEYYLSIHMNVVLALIALMLAIFVYGLYLFIKGIKAKK